MSHDAFGFVGTTINRESNDVTNFMALAVSIGTKTLGPFCLCGLSSGETELRERGSPNHKSEHQRGKLEEFSHATKLAYGANFGQMAVPEARNRDNTANLCVWNVLTFDGAGMPSKLRHGYPLLIHNRYIIDP